MNIYPSVDRSRQAAVALARPAQREDSRRSTWKGGFLGPTVQATKLNSRGPPSSAVCALQAEEHCSDMTMVSVAIHDD